MAEFYFEGNEADYINAQRLEKTLKFDPVTRYSSRDVSVCELLNNLHQAGIRPEDICGVYKASQNDFTFSLYFQFENGSMMWLPSTKVKMGNTEFVVVKWMSKL